MLVESLYCGFDGLHGVKLQPLLINRVDKLVHTIEEDLDVLFDLLVAEQVLEVVVRVVRLLLLLVVVGQAGGGASHWLDRLGWLLLATC